MYLGKGPDLATLNVPHLSSAVDRLSTAHLGWETCRQSRQKAARKPEPGATVCIVQPLHSGSKKA